MKKLHQRRLPFRNQWKMSVLLVGFLALLFFGGEGVNAWEYKEVFSDEFTGTSLSGWESETTRTLNTASGTLSSTLSEGHNKPLLYTGITLRDGKAIFMTPVKREEGTLAWSLASRCSIGTTPTCYVGRMMNGDIAIVKRTGTSSSIIIKKSIPMPKNVALRGEFIVKSVSSGATYVQMTVYNTSTEEPVASIETIDTTGPQQEGIRGLRSYGINSYDSFSLYEMTGFTVKVDKRYIKMGTGTDILIFDDNPSAVSLSDNGAGGIFTTKIDGEYGTSIEYFPQKLGDILLTITSSKGEVFTGALFVSLYAPTIGFIGDSITLGVAGITGGHTSAGKNSAANTELDTLGKGFSASNQGVSATSTRHWLDTATLIGPGITNMQKANTEVVQMMFGTNDSMVSVGENPDVSPADFKANMENIIASLKTAGFKKIVLNNPPYQIVPNGGRDQTSLDKLVAYIEILDELADGRFVLRGDREAYDYFEQHQELLPDKLHPNLTGHKILGELRAKAYKALLIDPYDNPSHSFSTGSYLTGSDELLHHTTAIDTRAFAHYVTLEGIALDEEADYTFTGNEETKITLLTGYLNTLQTGNYTLTVYFLGTGEVGTVTISDTFEVKAVIPPVVIPPTCTNGATNYPICDNNQTPTTPTTPSYSGGGGGGSSLSKDTCPNGDFSPSYYDKTCGTTANLADEVTKKVNILKPLIRLIYVKATEQEKTFVHNLITSCSKTNKKEIIRLACQELVENWDF